MTTSHLGKRYCGNKTVWKQIGCQLHIFKCIRMRTCAQTFTLHAYLCVQTTTLHEYLSATFTSPYDIHKSAPRSNQVHVVNISALRSNQVHVVNISAPRSNLHITCITQRRAHISTSHVYKNVIIVN